MFVKVFYPICSRLVSGTSVLSMVIIWCCKMIYIHSKRYKFKSSTDYHQPQKLVLLYIIKLLKSQAMHPQKKTKRCT